ncbi:hypothetical protein [Synechococcus phage S-H34]|uniref:DUF4278 domain-containing protein n=1 Tax=Synechococcus phage S-H34 TaxID=2718942 RepID=A0A6G8R6U8_9CAUD|nr:hypothetical protein PQC15_gp231 [Synechococcus phage S-H34]QIN97117.1 hypothetical protein [Synechococcus phage S-H34]
MLNLYSQITAYRGVRYDVNCEKSKSPKTITVTYRGISYTKEVK